MMNQELVIVGPARFRVKEQPVLRSISRRELLRIGAAAPSMIPLLNAWSSPEPTLDVHSQLLDLAMDQEQRRRQRFAAVTTKPALFELKSELQARFLRLLDGLPVKLGIPSVQRTGTIEADNYVVEKLVYESFPGYFVPALLYKPKKLEAPAPGVLSPCGHSTIGKAAAQYQMLHINLAKRGYVVLTYDPVGQGERSQFWDAATARSRYNLGCGEHAVLGNPLYLLGTSLARYRIWDGMRAIDYLTSLAEVDSKRIGCVGNSGGGTLTAYIAALDTRVSVVAIGCYITTLRRRMANRIQEDPSADPEQDIFGFMSEGIDHAGLLTMLVPRPALLATAKLDFFPIEGARESFAEAKRLYEVAGASERIERVEANERHGLSVPLRSAIYQWFGRWLAGGADSEGGKELSVAPRQASELQVCADGQVNQAFRSRPLLPLAREAFERAERPRRSRLSTLLKLDVDQAGFVITEIARGSDPKRATIVCVNGNEARDWRQEATFLQTLERLGFAVFVVDSRGVGQLRSKLAVRGSDYADPLGGVEENIAYNAFLLGKSLVGMRVADIIAAVNRISSSMPARQLVVCGRADSAWLASLAAAIEPKIKRVALEDLIPSFWSLFAVEGRAVNAASMLPGLLRDFGDVPDVLAQIAPRRALIAARVIESWRDLTHIDVKRGRFSDDPKILSEWLAD